MVLSSKMAKKTAWGVGSGNETRPVSEDQLSPGHASLGSCVPPGLLSLGPNAFTWLSIDSFPHGKIIVLDSVWYTCRAYIILELIKHIPRALAFSNSCGVCALESSSFTLLILWLKSVSCILICRLLIRIIIATISGFGF